MQISTDNNLPTDDDSNLALHFRQGISPDEVEQVAQLKRAQPLLQVFTALFHGNFNHVLLRLLVLRELAADVDAPSISRADINIKLGYLDPDSLDTVLTRLRSNGLLSWDAAQTVYRITPSARKVLASLSSLISSMSALDLIDGEPVNPTANDDSELSFILSQVAGSQAIGGVATEQLHHLLSSLIQLTEEFSDAIASGSEFQLRNAQHKWNTACDWVEKGSQIIHAITNDPSADAATHKAAQAIGRAQSNLLNMQGMFSRALNQIERQRVHLGQSGLSTTDIKTWLLQHDDLSSLADDAISHPVTPMFITPSEMIDVAESELLMKRLSAVLGGLPDGEDAPEITPDLQDAMLELDTWLGALNGLTDASKVTAPKTPLDEVLLPSSFAIASYRASLLPLLGDANESALQGATGALARLPLQFHTEDKMKKLKDGEVAAMSVAALIANAVTKAE
jgi:hypothetical protein